eukprot:2761174-Prymnesium_polylepis.1
MGARRSPRRIPLLVEWLVPHAQEHAVAAGGQRSHPPLKRLGTLSDGEHVRLLLAVGRVAHRPRHDDLAHVAAAHKLAVRTAVEIENMKAVEGRLGVRHFFTYDTENNPVGGESGGRESDVGGELGSPDEKGGDGGEGGGGREARACGEGVRRGGVQRAEAPRRALRR